MLPGQTLDNSGASYRGIPLAFRTPTGDVQGWIRTTLLGPLVTGGLTNVGDPVDDDEAGAAGLHGRQSTRAQRMFGRTARGTATSTACGSKGRVRQAILYGEYLELVRRIETTLGSSTIEIHDTVTDHGHRPQHMMIPYHMNPGHPLLDEGVRFHVRSQTRRFHGIYSGASPYGWEFYEGPSADWQVQVLIHGAEAETDGTPCTASSPVRPRPIDVSIQVLDGADTFVRFLARVGAQSAAHEASLPCRPCPGSALRRACRYANRCVDREPPRRRLRGSVGLLRFEKDGAVRPAGANFTGDTHRLQRLRGNGPPERIERRVGQASPFGRPTGLAPMVPTANRRALGPGSEAWSAA